MKAFAELMEDRHTGAENAYKTLHLYPGADVTVVGSNLKDVEFKAVRGAGETRIAAAAGCRHHRRTVRRIGQRNILPELLMILCGPHAGSCGSAMCGPVMRCGRSSMGTSRPAGDVAVADRGEAGLHDPDEESDDPIHRQSPVLVRVPGNTAGRNSERAARVEWRRVDQLRVGDRVVQAQRLPDQGSTVLPTGLPATVDALQWLGAYTGDGCLNAKHGVRMCMPWTTGRVSTMRRSRYACSPR